MRNPLAILGLWKVTLPGGAQTRWATREEAEYVAFNHAIYTKAEAVLVGDGTMRVVPRVEEKPPASA